MWIILKGCCELLGWIYGFLIETNYLKKIREISSQLRTWAYIGSTRRKIFYIFYYLHIVNYLDCSLHKTME